MSERLRVLLGGLKRFALFTAVVVAATTLVSAVIAPVLGESVRRSVTVGLYFAGSAFVILAFFASTRPPVKTDADDAEGERPRAIGGMFSAMQGRARFTTPDERRDKQAISWTLACVGIVVVILATFVDAQHSLI